MVRRTDPWLAALDRAALAILRHARSWLVAIIALGLALRVASFWTTDLAVDAYSYAALAHSLQLTGTLTMPWGDVHTFADAAVPSHHYPPLFPAYLAGAFQLLGMSASSVRVAAIASSLAAVAVTYACTRDLYGKAAALVATAAVAVSPLLVQSTGQGYSENLVMLLFAVTLWAILRSLERPWFMVPAGIGAGLGYLTKSSMGVFFVLAGLAGVAWRLKWRGWRGILQPPYLAGAACFAALGAVWVMRNWQVFRSWETSAHLSAAVRGAVGDPLAWLGLAVVTLAFYLAVYLVAFGLLPWLGTLRRIPRLGSEHDSGLWLALLLPLPLTALIDAALWLQERMFHLNNMRYVSFAILPAAWLLVRHADLRRRSVRLATVASFTLLVAGSLWLGKPTHSPTEELGAELAARLAPGDSVGFVDLDNHDAYRFYFHLTDDGQRDVDVRLSCHQHSLCPPTARHATELGTTWAVIRSGSADALADRYDFVLDAPRADMELWRLRVPSPAQP